jgi:peptidoglycan/xylan/chitin deacetylase (PgdA/CDA1 family)
MLVGVTLLALFVAMFLRGYAGHDLETASPNESGAAAVVIGDGGPFVFRSARGALAARRLPPRTVALTFDDGPDATWTPQIIAILRRAHVPATFFVIGSRPRPGGVCRRVRDR